EAGRIGGDDEVGARAQRHVGEGEVHAVAKAPAGEVERRRAGIKQLYPLVVRIGAGGVIHDLVEDDGGRVQVRDDPVCPDIGDKEVRRRSEIVDAVRADPTDGDL